MGVGWVSTRRRRICSGAPCWSRAVSVDSLPGLPLSSAWPVLSTTLQLQQVSPKVPPCPWKPLLIIFSSLFWVLRKDPKTRATAVQRELEVLLWKSSSLTSSSICSSSTSSSCSVPRNSLNLINSNLLWGIQGQERRGNRIRVTFGRTRQNEHR